MLMRLSCCGWRATARKLGQRVDSCRVPMEPATAAGSSLPHNATADPKVTITSVKETLGRLNATFRTGKTRSMAWRRTQLEKLREMMTINRASIERSAEVITQAVQKDLGKGLPFEVTASEINLVLTEIEENLKHLDLWASPTAVYTNLGAQPASSSVYHDPKGVVLIMSPWNYPVNLAVVPLAGAIAAGNCALLKLSRHSANVARTLGPLLQKYLDPECIAIENEGGAEMITELIKYKWDHIFFTGSVAVGRIVYEAAAKHLTPVTLELGGKNPVIVDREVDVELAARRIAWGKYFNAGQTCIGVDHVYVHKDVIAPFIESLRRTIRQFYGDNPKESPSFARVISEQHTKRLASLFKDGKVVIGGESDLASKYIAPTVLTDVALDSPTMTDEIFGPVMPLIAISSIDEAIALINARPLPLALYVFSSNSATQELVLRSTRSGAAVCNDVLVHFTNGELPFGGVGDSGIGSYHGRRTFEVFSHERAVIKSTTRAWLDLPVRYPPYSNGKTFLVDKLTRTGW